MLVSLITVCFNSEKTIRNTIESVLNQTYSEIEYIIVDGLSKDNTLGIVHEYDEKFKEKGVIYRVISEKDNGIYDAMNKGIGMAQGEIVGKMCILAEGDAISRPDITYLEELPLFNSDGTIK